MFYKKLYQNKFLHNNKQFYVFFTLKLNILKEKLILCLIFSLKNFFKGGNYTTQIHHDPKIRHLMPIISKIQKLGLKLFSAKKRPKAKRHCLNKLFP